MLALIGETAGRHADRVAFQHDGALFCRQRHPDRAGVGDGVADTVLNRLFNLQQLIKFEQRLHRARGDGIAAGRHGKTFGFADEVCRVRFRRRAGRGR